MTSVSALSDTAAPQTSASVLDVDNLSITYPSRGGRPPARAVDGVNLSIGKGEIVALIGESGCGKSTLARALVGLVKPSSGEIRYHGNVLRYSTKSLREYRRHVQLILQDPGGALNPRQRVYDAVAEGPRLHKLRDDLTTRVHAALAKTGLRPPEDFAERFPHGMSGGQQQRVVIAGALALDPSIIVADEPVASLDASMRGEILKLILQLRDESGLSALVVSHDLGLAWNIADRVAVMYLGRIVEIGTTEQVLLDPQHPYTKALLSVLPGAGRRSPTLLTGEAPDPTAIPAGCRFNPRCPVLADLSPQEADELGCRTRTLPILPANPTAGPRAACHRLSGVPA